MIGNGLFLPSHQWNVGLVKYAEDIPGFSIKSGYAVVSNMH